MAVSAVEISLALSAQTSAVGETFDLLVWVRDTRPAPQGVALAYVDVTSDPLLASPTTTSIQHGIEYDNGATRAGTLESGKIDKR